MRKCILMLICLCLLSCLCLPLPATASETLETDRDCSLTLYYTQDGIGFADLEISVYRVAQAFSHGYFQLIPPYSSYPVSIHQVTSQQEWKDIATTLTAYIAANGDTADAVVKTDDQGTAVFTGLETGLYYISGVTVEKDSGTYVFDPFMIYLPTPQSDGTYDYDMEAKPKCSQFVPKTEYSVTKLWKDNGSTTRPESITVEIRKDGVLMETKLLNNDNNWTYTWTVAGEDNSQWTVNEKDVLDNYTVTISQQDAKFLMINTAKEPGEDPPETEPTETEPTETEPTETEPTESEPTESEPTETTPTETKPSQKPPAPKPNEPPKTGDSFPLISWVLAMCISGCLLMILGIYTRRRR